MNATALRAWTWVPPELQPPGAAIVEYDALPPDLLWLNEDSRYCQVDHDVFTCTRVPGHTRRHAAGDGHRIVAVWPQACPEGFHWIGQPMTSCDKCGLPAWEHDGLATTREPLRSPFDDAPMVLRPWRPGEADQIRRSWTVPS